GGLTSSGLSYIPRYPSFTLGSGGLGVTGSSGLSGLPTGAEVDAITGVVTGSSFWVLCSLTYRVLGVTGVTGVVTRFVGLFVTGIAGASNDAIEVMGVLSRGHGPAETPRSTGGPSLGNWSWWGIRVLYVLVYDI